MKTATGKIVFAGGGTGGHIYPALAIIEALQQKGDFQILYVGGYQGMENNIIPQRDIPYRKITVSGFQRYFTLRNFLFPFKLIAALWQSWRLLRSFKPSVVVGTGGYVSGPVVYLAAKMGIPTLIDEQDSYPTGDLTRKSRRCLCSAAARARVRSTKRLPGSPKSGLKNMRFKYSGKPAGRIYRRCRRFRWQKIPSFG
ncbi:hypothetical protein B1H10_04335 [candidate division KSB1 bacterium 4484_188]|nr:MAG: hypothetical protein B1H10_04335 [candidate division KSB1 bacterium 4484_188]